MTDKDCGYAMVHGRFQPFHMGHFRYVEGVIKQTRGPVLIGITNPWPGSEVAVADDEHRHLTSANPFSYFERSRMVLRSLRSCEHAAEREILVFPFNLDALHEWVRLPKGTIQYVNPLDAWDEEKVRRFEAFGFQVLRVPSPRKTSGTEIRRRIAAGESISDLVPDGTSQVLRDLIRTPQ